MLPDPNLYPDYHYVPQTDIDLDHQTSLHLYHLPLSNCNLTLPYSDSYVDSDHDPLPELHPYSHHVSNLDP